MIIERITNINQKIMKIFINGSYLLAFGARSGCIENANSASYRSYSLNIGKIDFEENAGVNCNLSINKISYN
ncbi:MAG TPA: hypothetical protein VMW20_07415 [Candidatus Nanoarchaeia archaeon]|nr:hypothetical protein [Candidatus Nanoarchaeia archaeon]